MSRAVLLAAALVALLAVDARAASFCRPRAEVLLTLMRQYGEAPVAQGLAQGGAVIEVLASPDRRTWTIIASNPAGIACLLAVGEHWEPIAHAPRGEGS